jgi:hypothetical protein
LGCLAARYTDLSQNQGGTLLLRNPTALNSNDVVVDTTDPSHPAVMSGDQTELIPELAPFRVSPRTMQMLGRESISSPITAIMELVKNSYDADAKLVKIIMRGVSHRDGSIIIDDLGEGMNWNDLHDKWLVISTDNKLQSPVTFRKRIKVGEKGIGRLAMNRLGDSANIITNKEGERAIRLYLDWTRYEQEHGELHEILHPVSMLDILPNAPAGTTIHITSLRDRWRANEIDELVDNLALMLPPWGNRVDEFSIELDCDERPDVNGPIQSPMIEVAEFTLRSEITVDGEIHHTLRHRSGAVSEDRRSWSEAFQELSPGAKPACGPLAAELLYYLTESVRVGDIRVDRASISNFLSQYHGIRIYRDSFRVKPYGDPGKDRDWLGLNLRKVRNPAAVTREGYRISGNHTIFYN